MPYTMKQYMDEVANRLSRYTVQLELDPGTIEMLVNAARRNVQMATLQMFPERYSAQISLDLVSGNTSTLMSDYTTTIALRSPVSYTSNVYKMELPDDFISMEVVLVYGSFGEEGPSGLWEARAASKRELWSALQNMNTRPTLTNPIYCVEKLPSSARHIIYVSNGDTALDVPDVTIWYLKALKYLQEYNDLGLDDTEQNISYEFDEMVVYQAMLMALSETAFSQAKDIIGADLERLVIAMERNYSSNINRQSLYLPSREGQYPRQPIAQQPNNATEGQGG